MKTSRMLWVFPFLVCLLQSRWAESQRVLMDRLLWGWKKKGSRSQMWHSSLLYRASQDLWVQAPSHEYMQMGEGAEDLYKKHTLQTAKPYRIWWRIYLEWLGILLPKQHLWYHFWPYFELGVIKKEMKTKVNLKYCFTLNAFSKGPCYLMIGTRWLV